MKKFLAIALIATSFAACNSGETHTDETPAAGSEVVVPAVVDSLTAVVGDTVTAVIVADTTKK